MLQLSARKHLGSNYLFLKAAYRKNFLTMSSVTYCLWISIFFSIKPEAQTCWFLKAPADDKSP